MQKIGTKSRFFFFLFNLTLFFIGLGKWFVEGIWKNLEDQKAKRNVDFGGTAREVSQALLDTRLETILEIFCQESGYTLSMS